VSDKIYERFEPNPTYWYTPKSEWGDGAWQDEPDKVEWRDDDTRLPCLIVRGPSGALCGYVAVSPGHPWHGRDGGSIDVVVHGGITFADRRQTSGHICHETRPGEPDNV
jgi:hypothetical protein